jgi:hypothetical protein
MADTIRDSALQSVKNGYHTVNAFHTMTSSVTANTITTSVVTLDKTYADVKVLGIVCGGVSSAASAAKVNVVGLTSAVAATSTVTLAVSSTAASEPVCINLTLLCKEA